MSDKTSYEEIQESIMNAPMTYLPGLLRTCVQACIKKNVFISVGGMLNFIRNSVPSDNEQ